MRFVIICLMSFLLTAPTLVASKEYVPSQASQPASPMPPTHGDFVRYQAHVPQTGIVVGSRPDEAGNINIAPLAPPEAQRPGHTAFHGDRIVNAHPADIAHVGFSHPDVASDLARHHAQRPPSVSYTTGHVQGSPTYRAIQSSARRGGSQRSERTWRS